MAGFTVSTYRHARDLPAPVWTAFSTFPRSSNIIYAYAEQAAASFPQPDPSDVWIVLSEPMGTSSQVAFVLSCTSGPLGPYPVFIVTTLSTTSLVDDFVVPRMQALAHELQAHVPPERVFSVFSIDTVTRAFADVWTARTGIRLHHDPVYYHANLMHCDKSTFRDRDLPLSIDGTFTLRQAVDDDLTEVAKLCFEFAGDSVPFVLSSDKATQEAELLIRKQQLWVHEIHLGGQNPVIACIVAAARITDTVAAVTKVFTHPQWRGYKCAERLTRHVCQHFLQAEKKDAVVLYVAHDNPAAGAVYKHVGFRGYTSESDGVTDSWKEVGFERTKVELGHW